MDKISAVAWIALSASSLGVAGSPDHPTTEIANELIRAKVYLPNAQHGFYKGTRFDWSGVIYSLEANGHNYYGPWFTDTDPSVHDFVYRDDRIVAGPCSATTGPVNEFGPVGYDEAKVGGNFIKIGVGALRKSSAEKYDNYHLYEIADGGKWSIHKSSAGLEMVQQLHDDSSGYGYVYSKAIHLTSGKTEMVLTHSLKNTGTKSIKTSVYNHNFLVLDGRAPGPGLVISLPFPIQAEHPLDKELAEVRGHDIVYLKELQGHDVVTTPLKGFGTEAGDNQIRIENSAVGAGLTLRSDRPLLSESLWSIRTVVAMEPFIAITIEPGAEFKWTTVYEYYALPKSQK